ncbi:MULTISPECIES: acetolactate synthase large subunit [Ramlibacter]|uniref:Acetolactate synthase large subunit n=1 Tax=Ramlibacter aquaticus TaxID=2780094 RepID=A0ABR9SHF6_9BURK|nr:MULTISPECIES: acetolactate synthase large subunit [Ramlibacter]MBE7941786.1 acetolactate synthase large subunit [Ramlibacter aquaticus]
MNGAQALVQALQHSGVDTCFANPGTSEMHFVAALDGAQGLRCVLGLFEGVATGAADGYWRMAGRPAATLLHLGPGLANGLANLHNAKKARSGIVNIVGDHATGHLALDAPLTSDLEGVARPMSHWVHRVASADAVAAAGREAVQQARRRPGHIATLALAADAAWSPLSLPLPDLGPLPEPAFEPLQQPALQAAVDLLRRDPGGTLLLLGGAAMRQEAIAWAGRIAAHTGCGLMSEFYVERAARGAGRVPVPRLPYAVEPAMAALAPWRQIVLVHAMPPVAFFAYPGKPGRLEAPGTGFVHFSHHGQDATAALEALADALGARQARPVLAAARDRGAALPTGALDAAGIAAVIAGVLPEQAIVVDEAISTGRSFDAATRQAAPHDWLANMGGAIGFGLPVAVGAALAAPGRRVLALEGDGSAMYTPQALWTLAREGLDVTAVIFANRSYQILRGEFAGVGAGEPGPRAAGMLSLDRPALDWVQLSKGFGVPATRVHDLAQLADALRRSFATPGPSLIEAVL